MVKTKSKIARVAAEAFLMQSQQSDFQRAMTTRYGLIATGPDFAKLLERLDAAESLQKSLFAPSISDSVPITCYSRHDE